MYSIDAHAFKLNSTFNQHHFHNNYHFALLFFSGFFSLSFHIFRCFWIWYHLTVLVFPCWIQHHLNVVEKIFKLCFSFIITINIMLIVYHLCLLFSFGQFPLNFLLLWCLLIWYHQVALLFLTGYDII